MEGVLSGRSGTHPNPEPRAREPAPLGGTGQSDEGRVGLPTVFPRRPHAGRGDQEPLESSSGSPPIRLCRSESPGRESTGFAQFSVRNRDEGRPVNLGRIIGREANQTRRCLSFTSLIHNKVHKGLPRFTKGSVRDARSRCPPESSWLLAVLGEFCGEKRIDAAQSGRSGPDLGEAAPCPNPRARARHVNPFYGTGAFPSTAVFRRCVHTVGTGPGDDAGGGWRSLFL